MNHQQTFSRAVYVIRYFILLYLDSVKKSFVSDDILNKRSYIVLIATNVQYYHVADNKYVVHVVTKFSELRFLCCAPLDKDVVFAIDILINEQIFYGTKIIAHCHCI